MTKIIYKTMEEVQAEAIKLAEPKTIIGHYWNAWQTVDSQREVILDEANKSTDSERLINFYNLTEEWEAAIKQGNDEKVNEILDRATEMAIKDLNLEIFDEDVTDFYNTENYPELLEIDEEEYKEAIEDINYRIAEEEDYDTERDIKVYAKANINGGYIMVEIDVVTIDFLGGKEND